MAKDAAQMISLDADEVAAAHDAMAAEYDLIADPWYTYLYARVHKFLLEYISARTSVSGGTALDVGSGTGLQSLLLADAGYDVVGFDVSSDLTACALHKVSRWPDWKGPLAFDSDMRKFHAAARGYRGDNGRGTVHFAIGNALDPKMYLDGPFDLIVSCGSVLSFVDDPAKVLYLMREALKPGGHLILEADMKANFDLIWPVIDRLLNGFLNYDEGWVESVGNLFWRSWRSKDLVVVYPFQLSNGTTVDLPLRLFSHRQFLSLISSTRLRVVRCEGIHALTNLIPSTTLHHPIGPILSTLFTLLASIERRCCDTWPVRRLGCSAIFELAAY